MTLCLTKISQLPVNLPLDSLSLSAHSAISQSIHREESFTPSSLLWPSRDGEDVHDPCRCTSYIWSRLPETDPGGERSVPGFLWSQSSPIPQLNASDDRGIDVVREQIKQFAETRTLFAKGFKLIILDEADMMTQAAQAALRRVIEQYTKNVRFCIICNYVNKITPAIQSRCTRFRFSPLPIPEVEKRLVGVIDSEKSDEFDPFLLKKYLRFSTESI